MDKEYKKSWTGLILWAVIFCLAMFTLPFLPVEDGTLLTRGTSLLTLWGIEALMVMMAVNERVYWCNGVSFEEAKAAGSERRKAYAMAHVKRFGWAALIGTALTLLAHLQGWPVWIDLPVTFLAVIVAAFSTIGIKL